MNGALVILQQGTGIQLVAKKKGACKVFLFKGAGQAYVQTLHIM
jgi:hypothetical protein